MCERPMKNPLSTSLETFFFSFGIVAISFEAGEEDAYSDQATLKTLGIVSYESTRLYRPI